MSRSLDSKWLDLVDALDAAAEARGLPREKVLDLLSGLEVIRGLLCDADTHMALRTLSRLSIEDLTAVEPLNQFCGRPIIGRA